MAFQHHGRQTGRVTMALLETEAETLRRKAGEGDVISSIHQNNTHLLYYHTAGVPGRHDLDETQELNYPPILRAIATTGYDGYVGHEFVPKGDPLASLASAYRSCDV